MIFQTLDVRHSIVSIQTHDFWTGFIFYNRWSNSPFGVPRCMYMGSLGYFWIFFNNLKINVFEINTNYSKYSIKIENGIFIM